MASDLGLQGNHQVIEVDAAGNTRILAGEHREPEFQIIEVHCAWAVFVGSAAALPRPKAHRWIVYEEGQERLDADTSDALEASLTIRTQSINFASVIAALVAISARPQRLFVGLSVAEFLEVAGAGCGRPADGEARIFHGLPERAPMDFLRRWTGSSHRSGCLFQFAVDMDQTLLMNLSVAALNCFGLTEVAFTGLDGSGRDELIAISFDISGSHPNVESTSIRR